MHRYIDKLSGINSLYTHHSGLYSGGWKKLTAGLGG